MTDARLALPLLMALLFAKKNNPYFSLSNSVLHKCLTLLSLSSSLFWDVEEARGRKAASGSRAHPLTLPFPHCKLMR